MARKYFLAGGVGFIGSHTARTLLQESTTELVTIYDNFISGNEKYLGTFIHDARVQIIRADIGDLRKLQQSMRGHDFVYHFASNPEIARALEQPDIDFWEGTYLTQNVVEAMRCSSVRKIIYTSGSGVYGETGQKPVFENMGPLLPISTYGASKLAGEALLCSYAHMFDMEAITLRFANVVGPFQTHGVGYDFLRSLRKNPHCLRILGDGSQSKSYIHIDDVLSGIKIAVDKSKGCYNVYNLATQDYLTVKEIAEMAVRVMNLKDVKFEYTGGDRGWKGDVPVVRFNIDSMRSLGWFPRRTSAQAMMDSLLSMKEEFEKN